MEWLTEEEFLKITVEGDALVLNEVLTRVHNKTVEQTLCLVPHMVQKLVKKMSDINKFLGQFFTEHPNYEKHKDIVTATVSKIELENPHLMFDEVLQKAVPEIDKKIALVGG